MVDFETALGFLLRHAAYVREGLLPDEQAGGITPVLMVPGSNGQLAEFVAFPGLEPHSVAPLMAANQDVVAVGKEWTFTVAEARVNHRDAFLVRWTTPTASGRIVAFFAVNDYVQIEALRDVSSDAQLSRRLPTPALEAGMALHGEAEELVRGDG
jgi:hypothetical protein